MASVEANIWSSFLKESSKRSQNQEATCLVVGHQSTGKRSIAAGWCGQNDDRHAIIGNEPVSYVYFDAEEKDLDAPTRVNVWLFGDKIMDYASDVTQNSVGKKVVATIVLDLSQPDTCLASLTSWLHHIHAFIKNYVSKLASEESISTKSALVTYLRNVRINKGAAEKVAEQGSTEAFSSEESFIADHFGIPIVVIANKADLVPTDSAVAIKQARELQGRIRSICLEVGAALCYTSSAVQEGSGSSAHLKRYLLHRLYPDQVGMELAIEDKLETCFIPAGYDTPDFIKIATGVKHAPGEFAAKFKAEVAMKGKISGGTTDGASAEAEEGANAMPSGEFKSDLESEQVWLSGLYQFIQQVSSSGVPSTASSAVHSRAASGDVTAAATASATPTVEAGDTASAGIAIDAAAKGGADAAAGKPPIKAAALGPKRPSMTTGAGDKKEVGDFFKKLMNKK